MEKPWAVKGKKELWWWLMEDVVEGGDDMWAGGEGNRGSETKSLGGVRCPRLLEAPRSIPDVYISDDGGYSWARMLEGPHYYTILDSGGIIVAIEHSSHPINVIKYA